jgi:hypothetical protein
LVCPFHDVFLFAVVGTILKYLFPVEALAYPEVPATSKSDNNTMLSILGYVVLFKSCCPFWGYALYFEEPLFNHGLLLRAEQQNKTKQQIEKQIYIYIYVGPFLQASLKNPYRASLKAYRPPLNTLKAYRPL